MKQSHYLADVDLPADILEYAESSYGLSDVDLNRIASYIEECTKNLASIERQLAIELEIERPWQNHTRADLRLRKTTEIRRIRICRQIGAPIRQLPLEILGEIFTLCLPPMMTKHRARSLCKREAPLVLCRVCSSWRNAAINTPHLWKELEFRTPYPIGLSISVAKKMKVWVGRGGDLPVLLRLVLRNHYTFLAARDTVSLEETLSQEPLSLVCNLDISIPTPAPLYPSFKRADGFKRLESLVMRSENVMDPTADQSHLMLFPGASMLRRAVLINVLSPRISSTLFPWGQLTHLYAGDHLSVELWYRVMSYCVNLRVASFGIVGWWSDYDFRPTGEPALLPHLSILNIMHDQSRTVTSDESEFPFSGLSLPALRTLRIVSSDTGTWSGLSDYSQLHFLREFALIGTFTILPTHLQDLCRLFRATPLLSSLQLSIQTPYDALFANLLPTASPSLLPNLENLEIHCKAWSRMDLEGFPPLFINLIKARWWSSLQSQAAYNSRKTVRLLQAILYFNGMDETYLDIIRKSLQPCVDEGLDLHLGADEEEGEDPKHVMPFTNDIRHWHEDLIDGGAIRFGRCQTCFD
ncbi:uncharacterized protein LACBIDRAFT_293326 [Laccaria bicolor S238N-H82]|uniref:Predicted protein n=1 Tax=Laccaria bicolor (strain S238N-H82 / ATCC MYA-4686) TaxID=486041 RepID=B0D2X8_LACBS|nr:uncharacterized protein LACBIDRAFT_293326 [Laccaria bicolor S238N-H82]EDR11174.1 predicted protein [Laccaria bicolor S238N-H82]|eukprot:XP_001878475.1 predicted protein [Laccaria bicolor S238N-H82]